ncbi:MAG: PilZ domain-containing protein [Vulcanimicrobiota bacterium]
MKKKKRKQKALPGCENRRIATRLAYNFPVAIKLDDRQVQGFGVNISATGLRLVSEHRLEAERELELVLHLDDTEVPMRGWPVWQQPVGGSPAHVVGISFNPGQSGLVHWLGARGLAA